MDHEEIIRYLARDEEIANLEFENGRLRAELAEVNTILEDILKDKEVLNQDETPNFFLKNEISALKNENIRLKMVLDILLREIKRNLHRGGYLSNKAFVRQVEKLL